MPGIYKHPPEYWHTPADPETRKAVHDAFLSSADISTDCNRRPSGMYVSKTHRFDKVDFLCQISERSNMGTASVRQALIELKILHIVDYSDVHDAYVHPQATVFTDGYFEEHVKEAFRFSPGSTRQYYWDGNANASKEVRDYLERYEQLKESDHSSKAPLIDRSIGQFVARKTHIALDS